MKYVYLLVTLVTLVLLGGFLYLQSIESEPAQTKAVQSEAIVFSDAENNQFTIAYSDDAATAVLNIGDIQYPLVRARSASGVKYTSGDGSVVFWEHQGEAQVEIAGEVIFEEAMTDMHRREVCNDVDQDCTGGDDVSRQACGEGTILEDDVCVPEALDDDDDGDSIPTESAAENNGGSIVIEPGATLATGEATLVQKPFDYTGLWQRTVYSDGTTVEPADSSQFVALFGSDGKFSSQTDCNTVGGEYSVEAQSLTFGPLFSTKMFCADSQESAYTEMLAEVESHMFTVEDDLVLILKQDAGTMTFQTAQPASTGSTEATDYNSSRSY